MIKYQAPFRLINNAASSAKLYLELNLMKEILRLGIMYQRLPAPYHQSWYFYSIGFSKNKHISVPLRPNMYKRPASEI